ncbi:hypothetical protein QVD17_38871 [Tagetes erecta]|uniref:Uncharacterized protein n=1 Tax=Tagetes erecta TaxID=13708 RepID=A0AAD8JMJ5_TARER|nr:hypothetical protein QVD17_38871 [Tagetes erecta]
MKPTKSTGENEDSSSESKTTEAMLEKAQGKKPMDSATTSGVEQITKKAKDIAIDGDAEVPKDAEIADKSKGKATAGSTSSKTENVVKSSYSLRSGPKGMGVNARLTRSLAGRKRKGQDIQRNVPGTCKTTGKRRHNDHDDKDGTGAGAGVRTTRSSAKKRKLK